MKRFGFNVNGQRVGNTGALMNFVNSARPDVMLIMDNPQLASQLADLGINIVIERSWSNLEGRQYEIMSPEDFVATLGAGDNRLVKYVLNEPPIPQSPDGIRAMCSWLVSIGRLLLARGYRSVLGNFAVGSWKLEDIQAGHYDELIRFCGENDVYLGVHEYTGVLLPFGVGVLSAEDLLDTSAVSKEKWPTLNTELFGGKRLGDYKNQYLFNTWHLLRSHWFLIRADEIGVRRPRVILTEFGHDRMPDLVSQGVIPDVERHFGLASGKIAGAYSLTEVWSHYWPEWSVSEAIFEQFKWADSIYSEDYVGFTPFMWSFGDQWDSRGFNYGADIDLHNLMIADSSPNTVPVPDTGSSIGGDILDLLPYFKPDANSAIYKLRFHFPNNTWEHGETFVQTQPTNGLRFFHVKGGAIDAPAQWEELWYTNDYIYRGTDVSPSDTEYYTTSEDGRYGHRWIMRYARVGDKHLSHTNVTFRLKSNGELSPTRSPNPYTFSHWIEFHAYHPTYTFPDGHVLNDVVELWGYFYDPNAQDLLGLNFERYWYAKGLGLVQWEAPPNGWRAWFVGVFGSGQLSRMSVAGMTLPSLSDYEGEMNMSIPISDSRWERYYVKSTGTVGTNVRSGAGTSNPVVTVIPYQGTPALVMPSAGVTVNGGVWYPVRLGSQPNDFDNNDFSVFGYVHSSYIVLTPYVPPAPSPTNNSAVITINYDPNDATATAIVNAIKNMVSAAEPNKLTVTIE